MNHELRFKLGFEEAEEAEIKLPRVDQQCSEQGNSRKAFTFGRTDAEAEAPILWPPDGKN